MKKLKALFCVLIAFVAVTVVAPKTEAVAATVDNGKCGDNLEWTFDDEGTLTISGKGEMNDYEEIFDEENSRFYTTAPWFEYQDDITALVLSDDIAKIGARAFKGCKNISGSLEIPSGVTSIGDYAFANSSFTGDLVLPESVKNIGERAFEFCGGFTGDLVIPSGVTIIRDGTFDCTGFNGKLVIPKGVTSIGQLAFEGCKFTGTLIIPDSVISIESMAFAGCSGFTGDLVIPKNVTKIGSNAFAYTNFEKIYFKGNEPEIFEATYDWSSFEPDVTLYYRDDKDGWSTPKWNGYNSYPLATSGKCGENLTWKFDDEGTLTISGKGEMNDYEEIFDEENSRFYTTAPWFEHKNDITALVLSDDITKIGARAFKGCKNISGSLEIPSGVTSIGDCAFADCFGFTGNLVIPDNVTSIGDSAFWGCYGFDGKLILGSKVEEIKGYAFAFCENLKGDIIIPKSVKSIGYYAFIDCKGFSACFTVHGNIEHLGFGIISGCDNIKRTVFYGKAPASDRIGAAGSIEPTFDAGMPIYYRDDKDGWSTPKWNGYDAYPLATSGKCGENLTWKFDGNGVLTISGIGEMYDYGYKKYAGNRYSTTAPWGEFGSDLVEIVLGNGITKIGNDAFYACKGLTEMPALPESLLSIGDYAFYRCSNIATVPEFPKSLKSIGNFVFYECGKMADELYLPDSITSIGNHSFQSCPFKGNLVLPKNLEYLGEGAFSGCGFTGDLVIPDKLTMIRSYAFEDCKGLNGRVVFGRGTTEISTKAFNGTESLHEFLFLGAPPKLSGYVDVFDSDDTLYFYKGTAGWETPTYHGYKSQALSCGDANENDGIDALDLLLTAKYAANMKTEFSFDNADVTGDGTVTVLDVLRLSKYLAGISVILE